MILARIRRLLPGGKTFRGRDAIFPQLGLRVTVGASRRSVG